MQIVINTETPLSDIDRSLLSLLLYGARDGAAEATEPVTTEETIPAETEKPKTRRTRKAAEPKPEPEPVEEPKPEPVEEKPEPVEESTQGSEPDPTDYPALAMEKAVGLIAQDRKPFVVSVLAAVAEESGVDKLRVSELDDDQAKRFLALTDADQDDTL